MMKYSDDGRKDYSWKLLMQVMDGGRTERNDKEKKKGNDE